MLFALFVSLVAAFGPQQAQLFRDLTKQGSGVGPFVTLHDGPIADALAFTTTDRNHIYMDFHRLQLAPHTAYNVMRHEIAHTKGAEHGDGSKEMNYAATVNMNGAVIDDGFLI